MTRELPQRRLGQPGAMGASRDDVANLDGHVLYRFVVVAVG